MIDKNPTSAMLDHDTDPVRAAKRAEEARQHRWGGQLHRLRGKGSGCRAQSSEFRVQGYLGFKILGFGHRALGIGFRV